MDNSKITIIIVTFNSYNVIQKCIESLLSQSYKNFNVVLVESGSLDTGYLNKYEMLEHFTVLYCGQNIGFCKANNIAIDLAIRNTENILLLNPDVVLFPDTLEKTANEIDRVDDSIGIVGVKLLRYDFLNNKATSIIDSAGIFQTWYGRWYDRGQGDKNSPIWGSIEGEDVPAVCGAFMVIRSKALKLLKKKRGEYLNESFFMYKDDIEICVKIRQLGFSVRYAPNISAYHGRGWKQRSKMSKFAKILSARNEIVINREQGVIKLIYSYCKFFFANLNI